MNWFEEMIGQNILVEEAYTDYQQRTEEGAVPKKHCRLANSYFER